MNSKTTKETNELKNIEAELISNFIQDKVESFSDAEIYADNEETEEERVIGFR